MQYAVIETGNKQYLVEKGAVINIEKITGEPGETITFDKVSLYVNNDTIDLGKPYSEATVVGKVLAQKRDKKKMGIKYQPGQYRRKFGHRQEMTQIEITDIKDNV